jgi:magnesium transporter
VLLLSTLRRVEFVDGLGRRASLLDLSVDLSVPDYPPVERIIVGPKESPRALSWDLIATRDFAHHRLGLANLDVAQPAPPESLDQAVLLRRDVQDALVLDLLNRRAARANDLWLEEDNGRLVLRGVDLSARAVLRRITRGRLDRAGKPDIIPWQDVEFLRGDPGAAQAGGDYHHQIGRLPPAEIARLSEALPYLHATELLTLLPDSVAADTLEAMSPERQLQILEEFDEGQATRLLALMAPEIAADLFARLEVERSKRYLERLPEASAARVIELLRYPEESAGGIMTNLIAFVPAGLSVKEAGVLLRERLRDPDFVNFVYVVNNDRERKLLGVLSIRELLTAAGETPIEDLMRRDLETIDPLEPAQSAAEKVTNSHLAAIAVVGKDGRLLGAITIDAAVAVIAPRAWATQAPKVFS